MKQHIPTIVCLHGHMCHTIRPGNFTVIQSSLARTVTRAMAATTATAQNVIFVWSSVHYTWKTEIRSGRGRTCKAPLHSLTDAQLKKREVGPGTDF